MDERIPGRQVVLRPAEISDRIRIFNWLTQSDITYLMMGPPDYPDHPIPSWEEFTYDYKNYFFDGSKPLSGRCFVIEVGSIPIGQINHDIISMAENSTELDIWLKSSKYINKGYGSDALVTLSNYLREKYSCQKFFIAPSHRNTAAIRAYEKAGFIITEETRKYFFYDYPDSVLMLKTIP